MNLQPAVPSGFVSPMSRTTGCQNQLKIRAIITVPLHENRGVLASPEEKKNTPSLSKKFADFTPVQKVIFRKNGNWSVGLF